MLLQVVSKLSTITKWEQATHDYIPLLRLSIIESHLSWNRLGLCCTKREANMGGPFL